MTDDRETTDKVERDDTLEEIRSELERSADDITELTERVLSQTQVLERLETLVAELLKLLTHPAVVIDSDGYVVAMSETAREASAAHVSEPLMSPLTTAFPGRLGREIIAVTQAPSATEHDDPVGSHGSSATWVNIDGARVLSLDAGWALAVLTS